MSSEFQGHPYFPRQVTKLIRLADETISSFQPLRPATANQNVVPYADSHTLVEAEALVPGASTLTAFAPPLEIRGLPLYFAQVTGPAEV